MRVSLLLFGLLICGSCVSGAKKYDRILLTVKRNYVISKESETASIVASWADLAEHLDLPSGSGVEITDQNWGKTISARYIDSNGDKLVDYVSFEYTFISNEPIFTFLIRQAKEKTAVIPGAVKPDPRLQVSFLTPFQPGFTDTYGISKRIVESTLHMYPDLGDFPIYAPRKWNYEYSFFFLGCHRLGSKLKNTVYTSKAQEWIDEFINPAGGFKPDIYKMNEYKLDDIMPGRLDLALYEATKELRYKSIADTLMAHLSKQPRTSDGGYWHKEIYPNQMWLDGIFMADVFSMQYATVFQKPEHYDEAVKQIKLVYKHTLDTKSGLLRHGWDESKNPVWADPVTGQSPEAWARAVGWYAMALVECLDYLPANHVDRPTIVSILKDISASIMKYQDWESGLWFQVMDKGTQKGNWIETSASAMFAYTFAKGNRLGYLDEKYMKAATRAFQSLIDQYVYIDSNKNIHLDQTVKVGTLNTKNSKGDFDYYVTTERRLDDYKGLGALLFASIELAK